MDELPAHGRYRRSSIKDIYADDNGKRSVYYDLNGRKLNEPKTGLNIVNGKKVLVK